MNILFITDNFFPEVNAPASRTFEHCRQWVRCGHQVTVITGVPNFPKGKVYPEYRNKIWQKEEVEGIKVIRVITYVTANEGFLLRTLDYLSFMVTSFLSGLFLKRIDVIIGTSPQFFTVCSAWMLSVFRRKPFIFELRDLWPESIRVVGAMKDGFWLRRLESLESFLYRKASLIIAATYSFRQRLIERDVDPAKIEVVTNGVDLSRYGPIPKDQQLLERFELQGKFVVGYIGTHGLAHALESVLDAAELIKQTKLSDVVRFLFIGDGARKQWLLNYAGDKSLNNVSFLESVTKDEVVRYWSLLDLSIIHLKKSQLFESVIPSKLFESLAMGIPILHCVPGESMKIVKNGKAGLALPSENPKSLFDAITKLVDESELYQEYSKNCLALAKGYSREKQADLMINHIIKRLG